MINEHIKPFTDYFKAKGWRITPTEHPNGCINCHIDNGVFCLAFANPKKGKIKVSLSFANNPVFPAPNYSLSKYMRGENYSSETNISITRPPEHAFNQILKRLVNSNRELVKILCKRKEQNDKKEKINNIETVKAENPEPKQTGANTINETIQYEYKSKFYILRIDSASIKPNEYSAHLYFCNDQLFLETFKTRDQCTDHVETFLKELKK